MFAIFAALDGYDLGVGAVYLLAARNDWERRELLRSIAPVWDGNEVWLIAGGGTLFFAFPAAYSSGFSGFYLPLTMVLWLLILRGIAIEFRNKIISPVWSPFWDLVFSGASALLALFFGVALGNVLRGVPLDAHGDFFLTLWTDFRVGPDPGIFDWFTIIVGLASLTAIAMQGSMWAAMETRGALQDRSRRVGSSCWVVVVAMTIILMAVVPFTLSRFGLRFIDSPWGLVFPIIALASLPGVRLMSQRTRDGAAFLCSSAYILAMLVTAAFGQYPFLLSNIHSQRPGLNIENASTSHAAMEIALVWFIPGIILAICYSAFAHRSMLGGATDPHGEEDLS